MKAKGKYFTLLVGAGGFAALLLVSAPALAQSLGAAQSFAILGGTAVSATAPGSVINGDVGIEPTALTGITGFPANATVTPPFSIFGPPASVPARNATTTLFNSSELAPAGGVAITANLSTGGPTFNGHYTPGKYSLASGTAIIPTTITLDGAGIYVFSLNSDITASVGSTIILNGVDPCTVFWRVPTLATLNGATFAGTVVAGTGVHLGTGASLTGRALAAAAGDVTLAGSNTVGGCSAPVPVPPPGGVALGKVFLPTTISVGGVSVLTITLSNANTSVATLTAPLTDTLGGGLVIATPPNASTTCQPGGVVDATAGGTTVTLDAGATIPAGTASVPGSCTVAVNVTAPTAGTSSNTLAVGALQTSNGNNSLAATATLQAGGVALGKVFLPTTISVGGVSVLTITLINPNTSVATLTAPLTDTLLGGLVIATPPNASTTCQPGGVVDATAGGTTVTLDAGATIPAGTASVPGTCTVAVNVTAPTVGTFSNTVGALQTSNGNNSLAATATLTVGALSDSQEPGSVLVFPKFIRGTVLVDGVVTPRTEISVGAVCPPIIGSSGGPLCDTFAPVFLNFHWVCPAVAGICHETDFHGRTTVNGKIVFNTEGTVAPGNFIVPTPPCERGYLLVWAEDANGNPIKFDGLIGTAVLRESGTAVAAYTAIPIQADPALATGALIADFLTRGLVFDGTPGHYAAVTGRIYGDVTYDKLTAPFRSTFLTLLTLDVKSNRVNTPTFVDLVFYNSQEQGVSTSTNFICWEEVQLTQIDTSLSGPFIGSRKGVVISGPAQDSTGARRTLLGLVDTLEGPVLGNERMFIYGLSNDSVGVPTTFVPEGTTPTE
jgi:Ice-binding-like